jgi:hypothetical protein
MSGIVEGKQGREDWEVKGKKGRWWGETVYNGGIRIHDVERSRVMDTRWRVPRVRILSKMAA